MEIKKKTSKITESEFMLLVEELCFLEGRNHQVFEYFFANDSYTPELW